MMSVLALLPSGIRATASSHACLLVLAACSPTAVGAACEKNDDCDEQLICDLHAHRGTCQVAHGHEGVTTPNETDPHDHAPVVLDATQTAPSVEMKLERDPYQGWNLQLVVENFELTPAGGTEQGTLDRGHAHVYVDDERVTRMYTNWLHLPTMEPGKHEVRVELGVDDHRTLWMNNAAVGDSAVVEQKAGDATAEPAAAVAAAEQPQLDAEIVEDAAGGWTLHSTLAGFKLAPEHASTSHVPGEGSLRLYVDGRPSGRVYGSWHYLGALEPGSRLVLELRANDQRVVVFHDEPVLALLVVENN